MKKYKAILLSLALICFMVAPAAADQVDIGVDVIVAKPFVATAGSNADLGTLYPGKTTETVTMIVSGLALGTGTDAAAAEADCWSTAADIVTIQQGTAASTFKATATVVDPGFAIIDPAVTGLDLTAAFVSGALTQTGFGATATLPIVGTVNNVAKYAAANPAIASFGAVAFGPVITLANDAADGTYTGTMTVDITLK